MELLQEYNSDSDSRETAQEQDKARLRRNQVRAVYLVTYSQADKLAFPSRQAFARVLVQSFEHVGAKVSHWCCSEEPHSNGGTHYHAAVKLTAIHRWNASKKFLRDRYGITLHFSSQHHNYYSAWGYVTKCDKNYVESEGHPDLLNSGEPKTSHASKALQEKKETGTKRGRSRASKAQQAKKKRKRLSAYEVSDLLLSKNIQTLTALQALAYKQKQEGKEDLMQFLIGRSRKVICELIDNTWEIKEANEKLERARKSRIVILQEASNAVCTPGCNGLWLTCAKEILRNNRIERATFASSMHNALVHGRGKYRNVMITGPANCGKTFILKPLTVIFDTFCNPATGSFAWIGVESKECIFLNDFRWSSQMIPWHDLLLMLEGEIVHLPAPKTHFSQDLQLVKDTPIFCTTKRPLLFIKNGVVDDRESEMMSVRWKRFDFTSQIPESRQRYITPCGHCFARLVLGPD